MFETDGRWDPTKLQDVLAKLAQLSLLHTVDWKAGHYIISIHPMVSDWLKLRTSTAELEEAVTEAMGIVAAFISSKHGRRMTLELRREIRVYVIACLRDNSAIYKRINRSSMPTPALIEAMLSFAGYCYDDFDLDGADALYDHCVNWSETLFGPRDPRTIRALTLQADFYTECRDPATAARLHKRLLRLRDQTTSVQLAECYDKQGKYRKAQAEYRTALAHLEKDLPPNDPRIIRCELYMALNETRLSSGNAAEPLEEALRLLDKRLLNETGQDAEFDETEATIRLDVLKQLGDIYHDEREDFVKSELIWARALEVAEQLYGADDRRTLRFAHNLAIAYNQLDKFAESEKMYQRTLDGYEALYGPESEPAVKVCHCYGHVFGSRYRLVESISLHVRAVDGIKNLYGVGSDFALGLFDCLVGSYLDLEDKFELEQLYKSAIEERTQVLGADHEKTVDINPALGKLYTEERRLNEAEPLPRQSVNGYYHLFGSKEDDPRTSVQDKLAPTPAASNMHPKTRRNPCLDEESNMFRLATGPRHRSERSVADVNNPGKTKLIIGYPFMDYKPEMPYTNSLY